MKTMTVLALTLAMSLPLLPHSALSRSKSLSYPACSEKMSVAVENFRTENISIDWNDFATNARDVVVDELVNSGCYRVMARGTTGFAQGQARELSMTQYYGESSKNKVRHKQLKAAAKTISFAMTSASKNNIGGTLAGLGYGSTGKWGLGHISPKASKFCMTCRIYDNSTSEIFASQQVCKSKVDFTVSGAGGKGWAGMGGNFFIKTPLGKTIASAIHDCAVKLTQKIAY